MGNCACEIHFNNYDAESVIDQEIIGGKEKNSNTPIEKNSNTTPNLKDESNWKKLFDKQLHEIGDYIPNDEFQNLFNERITRVIQKNKLKFNYTPKVSTTSLDPIRFKNNNNIYKGSWNRNNEMEGYGLYYIEDKKMITEGIWRKGNLIYGRIFFPNGDVYEGEIKNSSPDGKGKFTYSNEDTYEGDFIQGEMTGEGSFIYNDDKTVYRGQVENGTFNGEGTMKWENGTEYTGNFSESSLNGKGIITNNQREKYDGNFDRNEFHGEGTYYYNNGDKYIGNFEYGIKRGEGKYITKNGAVFTGNWNDDLPNGSGELSLGDKKIEGIWRNGKYVGNEEFGGENYIDTNIKPNKYTIYPSSLPHLTYMDSNVSQFFLGNDFI